MKNTNAATPRGASQADTGRLASSLGHDVSLRYLTSLPDPNAHLLCSSIPGSTELPEGSLHLCSLPGFRGVPGADKEGPQPAALL